MLEIGRLAALLAALIKIVAKVLIGLIAVPAHVFRSWTVLKTWSIGSISDSIGLDGFGAKACGDSEGFSISMIG